MSLLSKSWKRLWPVLLLVTCLCLRAQLADTHPALNPSPPVQAAGFALAAIVFAISTGRSSRPAAGFPGAIAGAAVLLAPSAGFLLGASAVSGGAVLLALTLTPGVFAVAASALAPDDPRSLSERLWPSLAASAGVLLLIVQPALADWRTDLSLAIMPLLSGLGAAFFARGETSTSSEAELAERSAGHRSAATASVLAAVVLGFTWFFFERSASPGTGHPALISVVLAALCQAVFAVLSLVSLRFAGAERWTAQFSLLPLLLLAEGPLVLGVHVDLRGWIGLTLLLAASIQLLFPRETVH